MSPIELSWTAKKRVFVIVVALPYCTMPLVIKYASASLRSRMLYKIYHEEIINTIQVQSNCLGDG